MKLLTIIQKNFRIFIRSKVSALIIFLGPVLLVSLIGLSFSNTQLPGLTVGVYSPTYNDFTNSIISKVEENKFIVNKFKNNETCSDAVKKGDAAICLVFPVNMDKNNNEVTFVVDYSKLNLVWIVVDIFSNKVGERSTELRYNYATDLLSRVVSTKDDLQKQKSDVDSLVSKQGESKTTLTSASTGLSEINPTIEPGIDVNAGTAKSSISQIRSDLDSAKSKIADARASVSNSGLSDSDKSDITGSLDSANSVLAGANIYLEGNGSINSLEYIVTTIDTALVNAQQQLEQIKAKKQAVSGDLVTLESSLTDSILAVDSLNNVLSDMISRLENVQSSDAEQLVSPIKTKIEPVASAETHFNYLFPTLIALVVMITAILLSSTLVMSEKKSKSFFRNFITPTSDLMFNLGTFLTSVAAIVIQMIIFLIVSGLFFDTKITDSIGTTSLILLFVISTFTLLGMLIGYLFKSEETYVLAAITVSTILLFLSSTVMPIESISDSVRKFASFTPFVVSEGLLREAMFFKFGFLTLIPDMLILIGYIAIFFGVIVAIQKMAGYNISFVKRKVMKK